MVLLGQDFWRSSGWHLLDKDPSGYLKITDDFLAAYFERPELVPIEESCNQERDLHKKLTLDPKMKVKERDLEQFKDKDAAFNYKVVLNFRDFILKYETIEAAFLGISKGTKIDFPPLFVSHLVHIIVRSIVDGWLDPIHLRASEILFREQSVTLDNGKIMVADRATVQFQAQQNSSVKSAHNADMIQIDVLTEDTSSEYWARSDQFDTAIDIAFNQPALEGLCRVFESWINHFLKFTSQIRSMSKIEDDKWKWHIGLDASSNSILNDLYNSIEVPDEKLRQILALFSLIPDNTKIFNEGMRGHPVYLGLSMNEFGVVNCKPQNLIANLPLSN